MKKLNISSAIVGLVFGLVGGVFVYLFVPPPSTASADSCDCPSASRITSIIANTPVRLRDHTSVHAYNCAQRSDINCAKTFEVMNLLGRYCG